MIIEKDSKLRIVIFELNFVKTSLEWSKYSFKIDFYILKVLRISLEVKILKNDQICQFC